MNKQKIVYALTAAAFLGSAALFPTFASETQSVGNGAFSNTDIQSNTSNMTNVDQNTISNISNDVKVAANTGNNSASFNTGSNVNVMTGGATTAVGLTNMSGSNTANILGAGTNGTQNTTAFGNGAFSDTSVQTNNSNSTSVDQNNIANVTNNVDVANNTGNNGANFNTGSDVTIASGNANAFVGLNNSTGGNSANVIGGNGGGSQNTAIGGNGAFSNSDVNVSSDNSKSLTQSDVVTLANDVALKNSTGGNGASFNTGGSVNLLSGGSNAQVGITNLTNGNSANVLGGGANDGWVNTSIGGNGAFSTNTVNQRNSMKTYLTQNNLTYVANYIESMNSTGNNNTGFNTGSDVLVGSGNANSFVSLFNTPSGNVAQLLGRGMGGNTNTTVFGNGAFSNTNVSAMQNSATQVDQQNAATVMNAILSENNTGGYDAAYGTGGGVFTNSGSAANGTSLYNLASANYLAY